VLVARSAWGLRRLLYAVCEKGGEGSKALM
jgi:hypothetical protein